MTSTVLLVEDSPDDELLTLRALESVNGCRVRIANNGLDALALLEHEVKAPKLVLLDLKLPGLSGFEVLAGIRRLPHLEGVPVVVLSSSSEPRDVRESYHRGANSFVQKPVGFDDFLETVRLLGLYWIKKNLGPIN